MTTKPRDLITVLENPNASPLPVRDEECEALLSMLAHLFFSDGHLDEGEVALIARLAGGMSGDAVNEYIARLALRPLDLEGLGRLFPDPRDRDDILTLAEHGVWGDSIVEHAEMDMLDELIRVLDIRRP